MLRALEEVAKTRLVERIHDRRLAAKDRVDRAEGEPGGLGDLLHLGRIDALLRKEALGGGEDELPIERFAGALGGAAATAGLLGSPRGGATTGRRVTKRGCSQCSSALSATATTR